MNIIKISIVSELVTLTVALKDFYGTSPHIDSRPNIIITQFMSREK